MSIELNPVMDAIGQALLALPGQRVFDYQSDSVAPPAAVVALPRVEYDNTKARGTDRAIFPVHILVSKASDRASRDALGAYIAGAGATSVKAAIDGTLAGAVHAARVMDCDVSVFPVAGVDYLAATFQVEVWD
jgi:hypothetical protein